MKKRFGFLIALMMLAVLCLSVFAACGDDDGDDGDPGNGPVYVGLFTFTKPGGSETAYLNLKEDGTFYFASDFLAKDNLGTYEYNADKTKLTLVAEVEQKLSDTYDVVVENGKVVIKDIYYFYYGDIWYHDHFTYDTTSQKPIELPIEIETFYIVGDKNAYLTFYSGSRYELKVSTPKILSSGTYTTSKSGDTTTYTLTDTLTGNNESYTFTATYTAADGYSGLLLKGTGIPTEGIEFVYEIIKNPVARFAGTEEHSNNEGTYTETVTLTTYDDGTFELTFTIFEAPMTVGGTYTTDSQTMSIAFDLTEGGDTLIGYVTKLEDTTDYDEDTSTTTIDVTINVAAANLEYSVTLTETSLEKAIVGYYEGTGTHGANDENTETVTITLYEDGTFEMEFTIYGTGGSIATGTWELNSEYFFYTLTVTGGDQMDWVDAENGIMLTPGIEAPYAYSGTVKISSPHATYEATVTEDISYRPAA